MMAMEVVLAIVSILGVVQAVAGWLAVRRFAAASRIVPAADVWPAVTLLKPLHGDEPMLEEALASFCQQDYPALQIVFGVQDPIDPAIAVVRRLQERFPDRDIAVVVDSTPHGQNRKIANLINMLPQAHHDVLVIADSDVLAAPDCLRRVVAALRVPGTGVATTLYAGRPVAGMAAAVLGATQITHGFLPGALLAWRLGRQDCLGAIMAVRRDTLARLGGLPALSNHLADDAVLGRLVRAQGLNVRLAATVPLTTVPEPSLDALWRHELRWARTIQSLEPLGFAASAVQYPLAWAALTITSAAGSAWSLALFALVWGGRALVARGIDRALGLGTSAPVWLLPARDLLSLAVLLASYYSDRVEWRGHTLSATPPILGQSALGQSGLGSSGLAASTLAPAGLVPLGQPVP